MIGYRGTMNTLGKASARLDDMLNLLPISSHSPTHIGLAPLFGGKRQTAWRIWRRDASKTASPER